MAEGFIHVEVAGTLEGLAGPVALRLPAGACLADALRALGARPGDVAGFGIWGRRAAADTPLKEGDRIECYRPLPLDPVCARRTRSAVPGARARTGRAKA